MSVAGMPRLGEAKRPDHRGRRAGLVRAPSTTSELLLSDDQHFIHTAVGGVLREAGRKDRLRQLNILDRHAATMPHSLLRYAIGHLDKEQRDRYLSVAHIVECIGPQSVQAYGVLGEPAVRALEWIARGTLWLTCGEG